MRIDHINKDGELVEFVDQFARNGITSLAATVSHNRERAGNDLLVEKERAMNAERDLAERKVDCEEGKGLSRNDFTDEYKQNMDNPEPFTSEKNGAVPFSGEDTDKFLKGDGTWKVPKDTKYDLVTQETAGLMSAEDKMKLDGIDSNLEADDYVSNMVSFGETSISESLGNGKNKTTTFMDDGSIHTVITREGMQPITLDTRFNSNGTITRYRS